MNKINAGVRLSLTAGSNKDTTLLAQYLTKVFRPLGAKFLSQSGNTLSFRTEKKATKADILAALGGIQEATLEGKDRVAVNCQSPLGIIYEEVLRVVANDEQETRIFNIILEE